MNDIVYMCNFVCLSVVAVEFCFMFFSLGSQNLELVSL